MGHPKVTQSRVIVVVWTKSIYPVWILKHWSDREFRKWEKVTLSQNVFTFIINHIWDLILSRLNNVQNNKDHICWPLFQIVTEHSLMSASAGSHENSALIYTVHSDPVVGWNYHYLVYIRKESSAVNLNLLNLKCGLLTPTKPTEVTTFN